MGYVQTLENITGLLHPGAMCVVLGPIQLGEWNIKSVGFFMVY